MSFKKLFKSLLLITIILSLFLFVYTIIFISIISSKVKKRKINYVEDINITLFKSFNFTNGSSKPIYDPESGNLGLAGSLYLNCTSGTCHKEETVKETEAYYCEGSPFICDYSYVDKEYEYFHIKYNCSLECFNSKRDSCSSCPIDYDKNGVCSRKENDIYEPGKVCYGDNIIYFWKGKKYQFEKIDEFQNKKYTYLKNVVLKNENCSINTRFCGIVDDEENKLCLPISSECPPNVISTIKLNKSNYYTSIIDNKTVYYTFDENEINNKIIAGLYVETDIYINKEEENENNMILDTYSINGLLKDNYLLYRGIDLGYNPYEIDNIDEKGKSYLKVRHYTKRPNLDEKTKKSIYY